MTTTPQEPTAQEDANLFDDNFHEWLEAHGVVVGNELEEQGWRAHIDLNVLKLAILHLADHSHRLGMKNGRFGYVTEAEASRRERAAEERAKQELREKFCIDPNKQYDVKAGNGVVVIQERQALKPKEKTV